MNDCLYPAGGEIKEEDKEKAIKLIGEDSKAINADIGIIKNISPLFVFKKNEPLFYRPNEFVKQDNELYIPVTLKQKKGKVYSFLQKKISTEGELAYYLDGYNAKHGFSEVFTDSTGNFEPIDKIFKKHLISGNRINEEGVPDDESFYKEEFLYMEKSYSFGCWVSFETESDKDLIVPQDGMTLFSKMGKEQSEVIVKFTKQDFPEFNKSKQDISSDVTKILLLSDTCVESGFENHCVFATNQNSTFRYIHSSVKNTVDYASLTEKRRSVRKILLKRGSVLYLKNNDTSFLDNSEFNKIGYNYYMHL